MMPTPRKDTDLPKYIYNRRGVYFYRNPISRKEILIGRDRGEALAFGARAADASEILRKRELVTRMEAEIAMMALPNVDERALLNLDAILNGSTPSRLCGIYFLLACGAVVYVGQSRDCARRIAAHKADKVFDSYYIAPAPDAPAVLDELEAAYIAKFKPRYNRAIPPDIGRNVAALREFTSQ